MKRLIGYTLFCLAVGMLIGILLPNLLLTILIIFCCILLGYNLFCC